MNNTHFVHYDIHLDVKLDYTISRIFQEMSLIELETLHQLCELERTEILQSLALAVLKIPYAGFLLSGNRSNFFTTKETYYGITLVTKKYHLYIVLKTKDAIEESQFSAKTKHFVDTLSRRTYFWDAAVPCGSKNSHIVV